jgi:hypothetical protein
MTPVLDRYLEGLNKAEEGEQRDDFFLRLALWIERSFVAHRSPGDEQLQASELPKELLDFQLLESDGRELAVWLADKLSVPSLRGGALDAMRMLPGQMIVPLLSSVLLKEPGQGPTWSDREVISMLDTLLFRVTKEDAPKDLTALQAALRRWSLGRDARAEELAKRLLDNCTSMLI